MSIFIVCGAPMNENEYVAEIFPDDRFAIASSREEALALGKTFIDDNHYINIAQYSKFEFGPTFHENIKNCLSREIIDEDDQDITDSYFESLK